MPSFQRATMPENFYDITSDMLLVQPEPQYFYAELFLGALGISLQTPSEIGLPGRTVGGNGAPYAPEDRDRLKLASPMFRDVIAAEVDFAGKPGNTIKINRPVFANTTYTEASRRIASGTTISTTPIAVGSQQTNLTLYRYGGPLDTNTGAPAPLAIEAFDAQMGVHKAAAIHGTHFKRDFHRFIDAVQVSLLDLAANAVYPDGMTAVNDATSTGSFPMTWEQICRVERDMDTANAPTFSDGFRALVLTPTQLTQLGLNETFIKAGKEFPQYNMLFPQYVKSVNKFHIFKSTTLTVTNNSSSVPIHYGHAIAPGALLAGMGRAPRVAPNTNDNYGETVLAVWLADLAFGLANNALCYSVRSSA
jgi:hypothetical protein